MYHHPPTQKRVEQRMRMKCTSRIKIERFSSAVLHRADMSNRASSAGHSTVASKRRKFSLHPLILRELFLISSGALINLVSKWFAEMCLLRTSHPRVFFIRSCRRNQVGIDVCHHRRHRHHHHWIWRHSRRKTTFIITGTSAYVAVNG
jgi:hypothetical protein